MEVEMVKIWQHNPAPSSGKGNFLKGKDFEVRKLPRNLYAILSELGFQGGIGILKMDKGPLGLEHTDMQRHEDLNYFTSILWWTVSFLPSI